ncbi:MAG: YHYH domain-containing protein [Pseudobdellovibrionaceae bacterium]
MSRFIFLIAMVFSTTLYAHSGGTDAHGCHNDKKRGGYHCHKGSWSGWKFANKAEGLAYFEKNEPADKSDEIAKESREEVPAGATSAQASTVAAEVVAPGAITIASWNAKHMGRDSLDASTAASLFVSADIVTFQEVNKSDSGQHKLKLIAARLKEKVGEKICWALSEIPTGSKERYAYIWRNSRIAYVKTDGSVMEDCPETAITIRLGVKNAAKIVREPAFGTFLVKANRAKFVLASVHLVPSGKGPQLEVPPLFDTFRDVNGPVIIAGDFNLDSPHPSFATAKSFGFKPAMVGVKTSLKMKRRELNKPYDNFWFKNFELKNWKVIDLYQAFPQMDARAIYKNISDHSPILGVFEFSQVKKPISAPLGDK